jgi:hypothetical protein
MLFSSCSNLLRTLKILGLNMFLPLTDYVTLSSHCDFSEPWSPSRGLHPVVLLAADNLFVAKHLSGHLTF